MSASIFLYHKIYIYFKILYPQLSICVDHPALNLMHLYFVIRIICPLSWYGVDFFTDIFVQLRIGGWQDGYLATWVRTIQDPCQLVFTKI